MELTNRKDFRGHDCDYRDPKCDDCRIESDRNW